MSRSALVDTDAFVDDGYVVVPEAFPRAVGTAILDLVDSFASPDSSDSWTN